MTVALIVPRETLAQMLVSARRAQRALSWIDDMQVIAAAPAAVAVDDVVAGLAEILGVPIDEPLVIVSAPAEPEIIIELDADEPTATSLPTPPITPAPSMRLDSVIGSDDEPTLRIRHCRRPGPEGRR